MARGRDLLRRAKQWPLKTVAAKRDPSLSFPYLATADWTIIRECWSEPTLGTVEKEKKKKKDCNTRCEITVVGPGEAEVTFISMLPKD